MKKMLVGMAVGVLVLGTGAAHAASLTVNATCGLNGTSNGLQVTKDPVGDAFVRSDEPTDETHFRVKFWIDAKSTDIPAAPNDYFQFLRAGHAGVGVPLVLFLKQAPSNNYRLTTYVSREGGPTTYVFVGESFLQAPAAAASSVEVEWTRGAPGSVKVWINTPNTSAPTYSRSDINNPTSEIDTIRWGVFAGDGPVVSGPFCLDEYESYR